MGLISDSLNRRHMGQDSGIKSLEYINLKLKTFHWNISPRVWQKANFSDKFCHTDNAISAAYHA